MAWGVLTASLISGSALTALADQDVNHGPGVSRAPEVSQEAPGVSGIPPRAAPASSSGRETEPADRSQPSLLSLKRLPRKRKIPLRKQEQRDRPQVKQPDRLRRFPGGRHAGSFQPLPFLQVQLLRPDLTWTDPIRDDTTIYPGEGGFISMSIYANNLPGDVLTHLQCSPRLEQLGDERRPHILGCRLPH